MHSAIELIQLTEKHVPGLLRLSRQAGWPDYGERELQLLVKHGRFFGYQNSQEDIISCIGLFLYGRLASIGLVIVDNEYKRRGLGRRMVNACISQVDENTAIMLCATKEGLPLYEKAGFQTAGSIRKYSCQSFKPLTKQHDIELTSFTEKDFPELIAADQAAFGGDRAALLHHLISQSAECIIARNHEGTFIGYGLSVQTPPNLKLGPLIATSPGLAAVLVNRLTAGKQGAIRIDVPGESPLLHDSLEAMGFHLDDEPPLMMYQKKTLPARNRQLFAVISQALG
ncbi:GNAT family N-acetyltransferase [Bacillus sp. 205(2023)]|uniref:GNAT family N-acetyltransferase n=1 Tax=Bacillus sp. 205(2023) TaxID=3096767 RepID=UPI00300975FF